MVVCLVSGPGNICSCGNPDMLFFFQLQSAEILLSIPRDPQFYLLQTPPHNGLRVAFLPDYKNSNRNNRKLPK